VRYIVYGAGAIGGGIGGRLAAAGRDVVLIARGPHLDRLRADGLTLRAPDGDTTLPVPAVGHPGEITFHDDDVVVLAMKSQDTAPALDALRAVAGNGMPVVCAQNGVDNERMAARRFWRVYAMLVYMPATFLEPGVVILHGATVAGLLDVGRFPSGVDPLDEAICADLTAAGFVSRADPAVMRLKYGKLLGNLNNAVGALCPPGDETRDLVRRVRDEALACFAAAGIDAAGAEEMRAIAAQVPVADVPGAPRGGSSTWQSLARGTGSVEADYLNGEIAMLGTLHGVATPLNRTIARLAADAAREGRAPGSIAPDEILAAAWRDPSRYA
jgi:2-dehydropantoate 2-reductase